MKKSNMHHTKLWHDLLKDFYRSSFASNYLLKIHFCHEFKADKRNCKILLEKKSSLTNTFNRNLNCGGVHFDEKNNSICRPKIGENWDCIKVRPNNFFNKKMSERLNNNSRSSKLSISDNLSALLHIISKVCEVKSWALVMKNKSLCIDLDAF